MTEFKEFINVVTCLIFAVGVIIGGAFQKIISSLVNDIIMPVVSLISRGWPAIWKFKFQTSSVRTSAAHYYGSFLQTW